MYIKFRCPQCFIKINAESDFLGEDVPCPVCDKPITVPSHYFSSGHDLEGFVIEQWLGSGSMSEVYLARQKLINRQVALKIMPLEGSCMDEDCQRFIREAQTMAKLNLPC